MPTRQSYLPLFAVEPGMALAKSVVVTENGRAVLSLSAGNALTESSIAQLRAHHAQYVCVSEEDPRSNVVREQQIEVQAARLEAIFQHADLERPEMRAFYDAVRAYRLV
ncbi:hypothetical protein AGMMS49545_18660 [Betaproteobacteria bacterium]|nr:hypothetical protein AGMMS49545_18660 [Betaproteobacteria bacterium]GHU13372.1 hypothetical protein FACS189441_0710 [Betaproteobacteria bacterium]